MSENVSPSEILRRIEHFDTAEYDVPGNDIARAEKVCKFIECLTIPSGVGAGGPFILHPFQKHFIYSLYAPSNPNDPHLRRVRRAVYSLSRKQGKSALISALVLVHLVGPCAELNGEIYSAANDREQAAQVFKVVAQIVRADPELSALLRVVDSTKTVACPSNGSFYKAISAEAGTKHGLNPTVVIYDELAQSKSRELYDTLDTAMGAREQPLFITISTQSKDPSHILSKLIDDGLGSHDPTTVCHLYAIPDDYDVFCEENWILANPALGKFRSIDDLRSLAQRAQRMPSEEPRFRNLYANQRVSSEASLISRVEWEACGADGPVLEPGEEVYAGLDLSSTNDLTAFVMVSAGGEEDRVQAHLWKPADLLEDHSDRDFGKGNLRYNEWSTAGYLETTPGKTIDYEYVARRIAELAQEFKIIGIAFDRWRIKSLLKEFERIDYPAQIGEGDGLCLFEHGQGFRDMAPAIDYLERSVINRRLVHPKNPVLTWNMANAVADTDPAGNRKLTKEKAKFRIDGAVALTMALGLKSKDVADPTKGPSVYDREERGLIVF